jgi:hypothetical protein
VEPSESHPQVRGPEALPAASTALPRPPGSFPPYKYPPGAVRQFARGVGAEVRILEVFGRFSIANFKNRLTPTRPPTTLLRALRPPRRPRRRPSRSGWRRPPLSAAVVRTLRLKERAEMARVIGCKMLINSTILESGSLVLKTIVSYQGSNQKAGFWAEILASCELVSMVRL